MATTSAAESLARGGRPDEGTAALRVSELFERHGATVLGLCRVLLRNEHEAEDATQQTFLAAYRSLLNGGEPQYPAAWLATIARNECWAIVRRRMREPLGDAEPEGSLPDPVLAAAEQADLRELWRAIGALPRQQRRAILLREFSGLSYDELAVALGVSEPAVESLLFRARRELRSRLRPVYGLVVIAPLNAVRDAVAPVAVKLAAGATAVLVTGGTVAAVETHTLRRELAVQPAVASVLPDRARPVAAAPVTQAAPRVGARTPVHHPAPVPRRASAPALQSPGASVAPSVGGTATPPVVTLPAEAPAPTPAAAPTAAPPEPQPSAGSDDSPGDDGSSATSGDDGTPGTSGDGGTSSGEGSGGVDDDRSGSGGGGDDSGGSSGSGGGGDSSGPGGGDDEGTSGSSGPGGSGDDAVSGDHGDEDGEPES